MSIENTYTKVLDSMEEIFQHARKNQQKEFNVSDRYYGILMSPLRAMMRKNRKFWMALPLADRIGLIRKLYGSKNGEQICTANYILSESVNECSPEHVEVLDELADCFQGWGTVDDFCIYVLQPFLARYPEETLALMRRWNQSANRWKRRASVVGFVRKVGESGKYTQECIALCENLLQDPEDLVQKAVGWALKDNLRGNREVMLPYIKSLRSRGITSVITLYAIRDLEGTEREAVLAVKPAA